MKIKILADSTCDLPKDILEQYDITLAPLTVVKGDAQYKDGITITPAEIFAHVADGGELCSTAAVSIGEYIDLFSRYANDYDGILQINIGSGFSACYQNACLAAEEFSNVRCFDTRNLTVGQGLVVLEACRLCRDAEDLDSVIRELEVYAEKIETSFLVEKLDYLVKGGRCSSAAALGANLLNLKPCIELTDNKMAVGKKYRGNFPKCLSTYIAERLNGREDIRRDMAFIVYTRVSDEALSHVHEAIREGGGFDTVVEAITSSTVACHCGPGTLGVVFVRK